MAALVERSGLARPCELASEFERRWSSEAPSRAFELASELELRVPAVPRTRDLTQDPNCSARHGSERPGRTDDRNERRSADWAERVGPAHRVS